MWIYCYLLTYEMGNILKLPKSRKDKPSPPPDIPGLMD